MSANLIHFYKLFLSKEIREGILRKIENIKSSSLWNDFNLNINTSDIDLSSINYEDAVKERDIWENIAKLSIDLWRDFEYYGQFTFENQYESKVYKEKMKGLGCVYDEGRWKSLVRPSEEVILMNVFMYCVYILMVNNKEALRECPFCDNELKDYGDSCDICYASYDDMKEWRKMINQREEECVVKINDNKDKERIEDDKIIIKETIEEKEFRECGERLEKKEDDNKSIDEVKRELMSEDIATKSLNKDELSEIKTYKNENKRYFNKFKCDKVQDTEKIIKEVKCQEPSTKSIFKKQSIVNEYKEDNDDKKEIHNKDDDVKIRKDEWKCGQCGLLQSFDFIDCGACGESRGVKGEWKCDKCTLINKCFNISCKSCVKNNDYLKDKRFNEINKFFHSLTLNIFKDNTDKRNNHVDKWQCKYVHCREWNKVGFLYCKGCRLLKDHSSTPGDKVKRIKGSRVEIVWICYECKTFNDAKNKKCDNCYYHGYVIMT